MSCPFQKGDQLFGSTMLQKWKCLETGGQKASTWVIARTHRPDAIQLNLLFCQVSNSQNIHYGGQGDVKVMIPKQWSVLIETRSIKLERLHEDFLEKSQNYVDLFRILTYYQVCLTFNLPLRSSMLLPAHVLA